MSKTIDFGAAIAEQQAKKNGIMDKITELYAANAAPEEIQAQTDKMTEINDMIQSLTNAAKSAGDNAGALSGYDGALHTQSNKGAAEDKGLHVFDSLGEQLAAIANAKKTGRVDDRLTQIQNAAKGAAEGTGADGGFLLQQDFAGLIMESAVEVSPLLNRLDRYTCSSAANSMRWTAVDETDVTTSVFGGIQTYWAAEAAEVAASKAKFRENKLDLEKMMGVSYVTDEMLQDASFLTGFLGNAFKLGAADLLVESVLNGDGSGKPTGILKSPALVEVAKESGQAAGTLLGQNVFNMQTRTLHKNRSKMVWMMHPDLEDALPNLTIGKGSAEQLLWAPEGGMHAFNEQRILSKPVLFEDSCAKRGSKGDIMLIDPTQYILLSKGAARQDWSMHVEFLSDQMCFRFVLRCNGKPKPTAPLKIKNSDKTRSPFVTLAARV